jgi:hypothetical protein
VEARRRSSGSLAEAEPLVWLQLLDDRGASLTHETFLGRGVGIEYKVRARIDLPMLVELPAAVESDARLRAPRRSPSHPRVASGLHARVVTRTYGNPSGPRFHMETLMLKLLVARAELPFLVSPTVPALTLAPGPRRVVVHDIVC